MTSIEWTHPPGYRGESWNTTVGCRRVSAGCGTAKAGGCYAEKMAARLREMGLPDYQGLTTGNGKSARWTGIVRELPDKLAIPLKRRAPTCWFVDSMSDLFHEDVSDEFIAAVFGVMAATPQHRYIILTKRAERLPRWFAWVALQSQPYASPKAQCAVEVHYAAQAAYEATEYDGPVDLSESWPLPNVVLGVSVEDQATADERIPHLLQTPAACRMVSYEPALSAVSFEGHMHSECEIAYCFGGSGAPAHAHTKHARIDWVVCGGESGPGARPFDAEWARDTVHACDSAGVPVFVKQLGARPVAAVGRAGGPHVTLPLALRSTKGNDPSEWPADLRVRQWPAILMDRAEAQ